MQKPRTFAPLSDKAKNRPPPPFAVWDVETKPAYPGEPLNTAFLGAAVHNGNGQPRVSKNADLFFSNLLSENFRGYWLYAHNASSFDFHYLLAYCQRHKISWQGYRTGERIFIEIDGRLFLDSIAILAGSLAEISAALQVQTRKWTVTETFYRNIEREDWQAYLRDDCKALYQCIAMVRSAIEQLGGQLQPTLAATSMRLFRSQFLTQEFPAISPYSRQALDSREAYYGGRTEVFSHTSQSGAGWDINSAYPYAMLSPVGCEHTSTDSSNALPDPCDVSLCTLTIPPDENVPLCPVRGSCGRLYYPTGEIKSWRLGCDVLETVNLYGKSAVKIHQTHHFKPRILFDNFVNTLYPMRKKPGPIGYVAKKMCNSLYGKFAMRTDRERLVCGSEWHNWPWDDKKALAYFKARNETPHKRIIDADTMLYGLPEQCNFATYLLPQISACITARTRIQLAQAARACGQNLCYCDTDSVYAKTPASLAHLEGSDLGKFKRECDFTQAVFAAPKLYWLKLSDGKIKAKARGLRRKDAKTVMSYIEGATVSYKRLCGIFETKRRGFDKPHSEMVSRFLGIVPIYRPQGRAWTINELRQGGLV